MPEARPVQNRELLIDNDTRTSTRRKVDPAISRALRTRGYTETSYPIGRIHLDSATVEPSREYLHAFKRIRFDALSVETTHAVDPEERLLTQSQISLYTIGGFTTARIVNVGDGYRLKMVESGQNPSKVPVVSLDANEAAEILQDIRASTELGYSSEDTIVPAKQLIGELAALHSGMNVDRSAHYQLFTDPLHGEIEMNIGESYELHDVRVGHQIQRRRRRGSTRKVFELMAKQPLEDGTVSLGVRYLSGRKQSEMKLTADIQGTSYSDAEKQFLYNEIVRDYQHANTSRFGDSVLRNLAHINDEDSNVVRLG
ncbi:MAG: hypothetical protein WAQ27_02055 [Candidatus Microsaccharimonas sp.]